MDRNKEDIEQFLVCKMTKSIGFITPVSGSGKGKYIWVHKSKNEEH